MGGNQADADAFTELVQWAQNQFQADGNKNEFGSMLMAFDDALARGMSNPRIDLGNGVYEPVSVVAVNRQVSSVAHEMGHNFGRLHADQTCGGELASAGGSDPLWPDSTGYIEPTLDEANGPNGQATPTVASYGVDLMDRAQTSSVDNPFVIYPSATTYDFMSYCAGVPDFDNPPSAGNPGNDWTSARGWQEEFTCAVPQPAQSCPANEFHESTGSAGDPGSGSAVASAAVAGRVLHGSAISVIAYLEPGGRLFAPSLLPSAGGVTGPRARRSAHS